MNKKTFLHKPITRRDFIAQGAIGFSAMTVITPFGRLSQALGVNCPSATSAYYPFLVFDLAGGAALPANFLVGGPKGPKDILPKYDRLGWDPSEGLDETFGLPMASKSSKILQGIVQGSSVEARANLRMGSFCHTAQSDASTNPLSAIGLIMRWGYRGTRLAGATGVINSLSGGNSEAFKPDSSMKPLTVQKVSDLVNSVGFNPKGPFGKVNKEGLSTFVKSARKLNEEQLSSMAQSEVSDLLKRLVLCGFEENEKNITQGAGGMDARQDPIFQQVYQINQDSAESGQASVFASLVKGVLSGVTGPSVLTIGNCDYHNGTQVAGDSKDLEIGLEIGRAVQAAHQMKKPLVFQILTDGGCSNQQGTRTWISDDNDKCMTVVGLYRPEGPSSMRRLQVGQYTKGQSADLEVMHGFGSSPAKVACAVFGNYISLQVPMNQFHSVFNQVVPSDLFESAKEVEETLLFG